MVLAGGKELTVVTIEGNDLRYREAKDKEAENAMNSHSHEKHALEKAAIDLFVPLYNARFGKQYRLVEMRDRPDALLEAEDGTRIGLEVAHLFYPGGREAKILLGRANGLHGLQTLGKLVNGLNDLLDKKVEKRLGYTCSYPISLLIRSASPIWSGSDFNGVQHMLRVPAEVYHEIWLLAQDNQIPGWPHLIRLG